MAAHSRIMKDKHTLVTTMATELKDEAHRLDNEKAAKAQEKRLEADEKQQKDTERAAAESANKQKQAILDEKAKDAETQRHNDEDKLQRRKSAEARRKSQVRADTLAKTKALAAAMNDDMINYEKRKRQKEKVLEATEKRRDQKDAAIDDSAIDDSSLKVDSTNIEEAAANALSVLKEGDKDVAMPPKPSNHDALPVYNPSPPHPPAPVDNATVVASQSDAHSLMNKL